MRVPGELYVRSPRPYTGLAPLAYPLHDWTGTVTHCGRICYKSRKVNLSRVFAGQDVGVKQVDDHIWLVTFMDYDLGYFADETCRLEPVRICSARKCYLCLRNRPHKSGRGDWIRTSDPLRPRQVRYQAALRPD
jgi:putative transposase